MRSLFLCRAWVVTSDRPHCFCRVDLADEMRRPLARAPEPAPVTMPGDDEDAVDVASREAAAARAVGLGRTVAALDVAVIGATAGDKLIVGGRPSGTGGDHFNTGTGNDDILL